MNRIDLPQCPSTSDHLKSLIAQGELMEDTWVTTPNQTSGRGQRGNTWISSPNSNISASVYKTWPAFPVEKSFLISQYIATVLVQWLGDLGLTDAQLKWPNDILINKRKVSGLIAEVVGDGVVIGIGINVGMSEDQLPVETATSLLVEGGVDLTRDEILCEVLEEFEDHFLQWDQGIDEVQALYVHLCGTLGKEVRVEYPGGATHLAIAESISDIGALILDDGTHVQSADVIHLR